MFNKYVYKQETIYKERVKTYDSEYWMAYIKRRNKKIYFRIPWGHSQGVDYNKLKISTEEDMDVQLSKIVEGHFDLLGRPTGKVRVIETIQYIRERISND